MKNCMVGLGLLVLVCVSYGTKPLVDLSSVKGFWQTYENGKPASILHVFHAPAGDYRVRVIRIMKTQANKNLANPGGMGIPCGDSKVKKPILCSNVAWGFKKTDDNRWTGGRACDPESGKSYKAKMWLEDDGQTLKMRGYAGISLFGRTVTWKRATEPKIPLLVSKDKKHHHLDPSYFKWICHTPAS